MQPKQPLNHLDKHSAEAVAKVSTVQYLLKRPLQLCAFGFGSGLLKPAPGTWGTLLASLLFLPFASLFDNVLFNSIFIMISFIFGVFVCEKASRALGVHDFGGIVWDEFVGVWLVLLFMPELLITHYGLLLCTFAAFALFRFFDIVKPPPIKQIDQRVSGGFGIMIDDIVAALFALALLHIATLLH